MAQVILFDDLTEPKLLNSNLSYFQDTTSKMKIGQIVVRDFTPITSGFPNFGISNSTFWIKFTVKNTSEDSLFILNLAAPTLDRVSLFIPIDIESNNFSSVLLGEELLFNQRAYLDPNYLFDIVLLKNVPKTIYFKIKSKEAIQLPIYLGTKNTIFNQLKKRDILSGIYFGIMIAMIFYNLFVYFSVRDKSYIYYVVYIILILLTQTSLQGYPFQYLWPSFPEIAQYSLFIFPSLVGIASLLFMNVFLHIKSFNVSLYRYSYVFSTVYIFSIILAFFNQFKLSFLVMEFNAICVSIFMLITSIYIIRRGYYPARYFLAAWSVFLIGVIIYILKDLEILPYNNLTRYTM
ncbi:MAG: ATPase, partial [Flavobacteriales bacterium CG18_big_fil_WC_8_21_14_2_50_32_9]